MGEGQVPGLWAPQRRALTVGLVLTITFVASEALAVVTVMLVVARDLGGLRLYGWVFSGFMLGSVVGIGRPAARPTGGARGSVVAGVVLFGSGLAVAGLAPSMGVLVAGRVLQGLGAGAVPSVAYATIGRSLPETLRPRSAGPVHRLGRAWAGRVPSAPRWRACSGGGGCSWAYCRWSRWPGRSPCRPNPPRAARRVAGEHHRLTDGLPPPPGRRRPGRPDPGGRVWRRAGPPCADRGRRRGRAAALRRWSRRAR